MIGFNNLGRLGRLGNQMFQYAALLAIARRHQYDFCIPPSQFTNEWTDHQLYQAFDLPSLRCSGWVRTDTIAKESTFAYDARLFDSCANYSDLHGYFQTERYFEHISDIIAAEFAFKAPVVGACRQYLRALKKPCISLHVRRTDYLNESAIHPPCSLDYYANALKLVPTDLPILVVSDDPKWCREQQFFRGPRWFFSKGNSNIIDLCLMTQCDHHIIANSSFSWWGAWLGHNPDKIVVAPNRWFGTGFTSTNDTSDLLPIKWLAVQE